MTNIEMLIYTVSLIAMMQALVTALLLTLHGSNQSNKHANMYGPAEKQGQAGEWHKWVGPVTFLLIAVAFSAGVIGPLGLYTVVPGFAVFHITIVYLVPPLLYAFAVVISQFEAKIEGHWLIHISPAMLASLFCFFIFLGPANQVEASLLKSLPYLWAAFVSQAGIYFLLSIRVIMHDVKQLKEVFSYRGSQAEDRLKRIFIMLLIPWLVMIVDLLLQSMFVLSFEARASFEIIRLAFLIGVFIIPIYPSPLVPLAKQEYAATDPKSNGPELTGPEFTVLEKGDIKTRYQRSKIDTLSAERIVARLKVLMEEEKLFLSPFLTLQDLSSHSGVPKHKLSQALNVHLQKSFFDYINEWRVNHVVLLLNEKPDETLTNIAFEAGFNSKSTFNKAFKTVTGKTPTTFRKQLESQDKHESKKNNHEKRLDQLMLK